MTASADKTLRTLKQVRLNIDAFLVHHPRFRSIKEEIRALIAMGLSKTEGESLLITGPSGTGKTTLRYWVEEDYPRIPDKRLVDLPGSPTPIYTDHVPVLIYELPSHPRPIAVVQGLLQKLGDPAYNSGRFHDCCNRLDAFLRACGTTTVVLDEVQRLIDRAGVVTSEAVLEELKRIHGLHGISLIFMGLGRIKRILEADVQLRDRWSVELRLENFRCFSYGEKDNHRVILQHGTEWSSWLGVLAALQKVTGLKSEVPLSSDDWGKRLYYATAGVLRRLKILLRRALVLLERAGTEVLSLEILWKAYSDLGRGTANPFEPVLATEELPTIGDDYEVRADIAQRRKQQGSRSASSKKAAVQNAGAIIKNALMG